MIFTYSCVHHSDYNTDHSQQVSRQEKINNLMSQMDKLYKVNEVYPAFTNPKFLNTFSKKQCKNGNLVLDTDKELFKVTTVADKACLAKWYQSYISYLNYKYDFSKVQINFKVSQITDYSKLSETYFEKIETFTRKMYKNAYMAEVDNIRIAQEKKDLEEMIRAEENYQEQRRQQAAMTEAANQIGRAISGSFQQPATSNSHNYGQQNYNSGGKLYSKDGKFLGNVNNNQYDPDSISNPYGKYGSEYSSESINNPYGTYGSQYSDKSPNNQYSDGAKLYSNDGKYLGNVNGNQYDPNSTSNPYGKYGSEYSNESINNPYGTYGNPYSNQHVPNNLGK